MHQAAVNLTISDDALRARHHRALSAALRGEVRFGAHDRLLYATDASLYQVQPLGVVVPADVSDAHEALRYCARHNLPVLPRGGGTSLAGQCVNRAVVIDLSPRCTRLLEVNPGERWCRVEPGITIDDLNDQLSARATGLFFAPDPATARQANIGGVVGNNAAGTRSIRYGRTSENLLGVDAMLATGERVMLDEGAALRDPVARRLTAAVAQIVRAHAALIRERFPRTIRRNAGYALDMVLQAMDLARAEAGSASAVTLAERELARINLAHLLCGSEGTLALTAGATLKLHPIPRAKGLAVVGFANLEEAIDIVPSILALSPSAVELLDDMVIGLARANVECARYVQLMPQPREGRLEAVLYVEFFSDTGPDEIAHKFDRLRALIERERPAAALARYTDAPSMAAALKLRKSGEPLLHGIPGARKPLGFVEDNAVPVERLGEFVRGFKRIVAAQGTIAAFYAHASVGVLHVRPLLNLRDPADRLRMEAIALQAADLARELGGVMSGEHGDGRARGPLLERFFGPELMRAFAQVKAVFDPANVLNPGNIIAPEPLHTIHERTRVRPLGKDVRAPDLETWFDYDHEGGFDHAVELCNGSGVCRKKQGGTMCPSYMATLDERHSTRGRGNALRLAITGQFGAHEHGDSGSARADLNDPETLATLRLCLSCKGCKTECPTNVDIAQYKAEYQAMGFRERGGAPISAHVLGNVRLINRLGSMFPGLANAAAGSAIAKAANAALLGLDARRHLPRFAPSLLRRVRARSERVNAGLAADAPRVLLYADCFTTYNEPEIGLDAIRVFNAMGYRVQVIDAGCCGRAAISTGLLDRARTMVETGAERLEDAIERFKPAGIAFCEPSCLSSIKDEWQRLKCGAGRESRRRIAGLSFLAEDLIDRLWDDAPRRLSAERAPAPVLLHGHCHQKALWGAQTSAKALQRIADVRVLDTGCCGMAGSFGYTTDRYDLSMRIGELALFPAAREMQQGQVLCAPGTSCRHQVRDGTRIEALHPVQVLARAIGEQNHGSVT